jgi:FkbM family methyltransferase
MEKKTERRLFLGGALTGVVAGSVTGFFAGRSSTGRAGGAVHSPQAGAPPDPSVRGGGTSPSSFPHVSYAQQGEDLIIRSLLEPFRISRPSYLDIGASDPIVGSNTYLFYAEGGRGVLVEPNPALTAKIQQVRPKDRLLPIGVGVSDTAEADYYIIRGDGQLNTFSKEQADGLVRKKGPEMLERVIKVPLVNVNEVISQNFDVAPNVLSIDTEGLDLDILRALDFTRYRPQVICAETLDGETGQPETDILELLHAKSYSVRGATFVNTVFLANELLVRPGSPARSKGGDGG